MNEMMLVLLMRIFEKVRGKEATFEGLAAWYSFLLTLNAAHVIDEETFRSLKDTYVGLVYWEDGNKEEKENDAE